MKLYLDVRAYAAENGFKEEEAFKQGMDEKSEQFLKDGADIYHKV